MPIELEEIFKNQIPIDESLDATGFRVVIENGQIKKIAKNNDTAGGVTVHSNLQGLDNDDHPQYLNNVRGDLRYPTKSQFNAALLEKADNSTVVNLQNALNAKQDALVSGTNIKTINGNPILGGGNLNIGGEGGAIQTSTKAALSMEDSAGTFALLTDYNRGLWQKTANNWISVNGRVFDVTAFGAKGDGRRLAGATVASGSLGTVTFSSSVLTSADDGKKIRIKGADATGNGYHISTITYVSATQATLQTPALSAVSSVMAFVGTDDTAAFQMAIDAVRNDYMIRANHLGGRIYVPRADHAYLIDGRLDMRLSFGIHLEGDTAPASLAVDTEGAICFFHAGKQNQKQSFTVTSGQQNITINNHGYTNGDRVAYHTTGIPPTHDLTGGWTFLQKTAVLRVIVVDANTIKVSYINPNAPTTDYIPTFSSTGTGTHTLDLRRNNLIDAETSFGLTFKKLRLFYLNPLFKGDLLDFTNNGTGDSTTCVIEEVQLMGYNENIDLPDVNNCRSLVNLSDAIDIDIQRSQFIFGGHGIIGRTGGGYSNQITITNCNIFLRNRFFHIKNAGESWLIMGNNFEGTLDPVTFAGNNPSGHRAGAYTEDSPSTMPVMFIGNWFGDGGSGGRGWIEMRGSSLIMRDNAFSTAGAGTPMITVNHTGFAVYTVDLMGNTYSHAGFAPCSVLKIEGDGHLASLSTINETIIAYNDAGGEYIVGEPSSVGMRMHINTDTVANTLPATKVSGVRFRPTNTIADINTTAAEGLQTIGVSTSNNEVTGKYQELIIANNAAYQEDRGIVLVTGHNETMTPAFRAGTDFNTSYKPFQISTTGGLPAAAEVFRGAFFVERGGAGVKDSVKVCLKQTDGSYEWETVPVS